VTDVASIVRAAEADGALVLGVPVSAEGPVADPVGTADALAGLPGWLLPQVAFLRDALEALRGDPAEINANAATLRSAAEDLKAEGLALGEALDGTAAMAVISGKLVHELRGIVFGMVCELATDLTKNALIAVAAAPHTNGGSIAVFCGVANARAAATAGRIRDRIATLLEALDRQADRLAELEALMQAVTP
jgi:hypothetical protein